MAWCFSQKLEDWCAGSFSGHGPQDQWDFQARSQAESPAAEAGRPGWCLPPPHCHLTTKPVWACHCHAKDSDFISRHALCIHPQWMLKNNISQIHINDIFSEGIHQGAAAVWETDKPSMFFISNIFYKPNNHFTQLSTDWRQQSPCTECKASPVHY